MLVGGRAPQPCGCCCCELRMAGRLPALPEGCVVPQGCLVAGPAGARAGRDRCEAAHLGTCPTRCARAWALLSPWQEGVQMGVPHKALKATCSWKPISSMSAM